MARNASACTREGQGQAGRLHRDGQDEHAGPGAERVEGFDDDADDG